MSSYCIYINSVPLYISDQSGLGSIAAQEHCEIHDYERGRKGLFNYIDAYEKSPDRNPVILLVKDSKECFKQFKSIYKVIKASGGLVFNEQGQLLAIYRRGHWDLPKGKIEAGESKKEAAIREVQEETGIDNIECKERIGKTYHTYSTSKHKRVLKVSYWYEMETNDKFTTPQTEEDIELVEWVDPQKFMSQYKPIYRNIEDIISVYLKENDT